MGGGRGGEGGGGRGGTEDCFKHLNQRLLHYLTNYLI